LTTVLVIAVLAYLIGSIPTSVWTGKLVYKIDVREHGSGNAGATNVFRVLGWKAGVFTALVDMAKGAFAALVVSKIRLAELPATWIGWDTTIFLALVGALFAVVGHMFPLYAGFKGGKGVATAGGGLMALTPLSLLISLVTFALSLFTTRYVSLSSILAAFVFPTSLAVRKYVLGHGSIDTSLIVFSTFLALGIIVAHRSNIGRLLSGTENRVKSFRPTSKVAKN